MKSHRTSGLLLLMAMIVHQSLLKVSLLTIVGLSGLTCSVVESKAILGVDLGSLYMKVALVQRNAPLEIVTNLHSKRKTENMILFDQNTRFYGADASSLLARKPQKTPAAMTIMLGRPDEHPTVQVLAERHYPITPEYNESRAGVTLKVDGTDYTPEELVAMVLSHAKDITAAFGQENVKDLVLTVPSFATQHERRALLDAAMLADFNVLGLIDENTASALNFGMDKVMEEPQYIIFYNMGASSLQVSLVKYLSYPFKESKYAKEKNVGGFEVISKSWNTTLGGLSFDHELVEFMATEFNEKFLKNKDDDIRSNKRAMTKLRLQANKAKHVLSANTNLPVYIDSLYKDISYSTTITRDQLEEMCSDLIESATKPIVEVMALAEKKGENVTWGDIHDIEMLGGAMRVPSIQEAIKKLLKKEGFKSDDLGMHINSDESMALGAAFHGANVSTAFRVRHVGMQDINPFAISISLNDLNPPPPIEDKKKKKKDKDKKDDSEEENDDDKPWSKHATMFKSNTKNGVKKTIAFTHDREIHCSIDYIGVEDDEDSLVPEGTELSIEKYNITGVEEFAKEMVEKGLGKPKVSLQFELSTSGITSLIKAEASVVENYTVQEEVEIDDDDDEGSNETDATTTEGDESKTEERKTKEEEEEEASETAAKDESANAETEAKATDDEGDAEKKDGDDATNATDESEESKNETEKTEKKKKKTKLVEKEKKKTHRRTLQVTTYHEGRIRPYTPEIMEASKLKLEEMAKSDKERMLLEEARNKVESFIYHIKNKLVDDEEQINKVSTEEQREHVSKLSMDAEEWMYDDGYNADLETMNAKYEELATPFNKILHRTAELTKRPEAVAALKKKLGKVEELMEKWKVTFPHITEDERNDVLSKVEDVKKWISDKEDEQAKYDPWDDPIFNSTDLPLQTKPLEVLVTKLSKKPKPKPKKDENATKGENATEDGGGNETDDSANATSSNEPDADHVNEGDEDIIEDDMAEALRKVKEAAEKEKEKEGDDADESKEEEEDKEL